jgi:hypothetical protein
MEWKRLGSRAWSKRVKPKCQKVEEEEEEEEDSMARQGMDGMDEVGQSNKVPRLQFSARKAGGCQFISLNICVSTR